MTRCARCKEESSFNNWITLFEGDLRIVCVECFVELMSPEQRESINQMCEKS